MGIEDSIQDGPPEFSTFRAMGAVSARTIADRNRKSPRVGGRRGRELTPCSHCRGTGLVEMAIADDDRAERAANLAAMLASLKREQDAAAVRRAERFEEFQRHY